MKYKLVIFDWDGTVMDSVGRIVSSMQAAANSSGIAIPTEQAVKDIIGLSLDKALDKLFPQADEQQRLALVDGYRDQYVTLNKTETPLFSGAEHLLNELRDTGHYLAVATGKARRGLNRVFESTALGDRFHTSRCADEAESKPSPDMIHQIMTELSVEPEQTIMIGDSMYDMEMARSAGVARIGVTHGVHDHETLKDYQPVLLADSLHDVKQFLLSK